MEREVNDHKRSPLSQPKCGKLDVPQLRETGCPLTWSGSASAIGCFKSTQCSCRRGSQPNNAVHRTQSRCGKMPFEEGLLGCPSQKKAGSGDRRR
jgi:hypothetical protein